FTRANKSYVKMLDNSGSCTTGNDPWDWTGTGNDTFVVSAWIDDATGLTCADIGKKYYIVSKWDGSSQCSYAMYLEAIDGNGGCCCSNAEVVTRVRAVFDDAGSTFNCATPCELAQSTTNLFQGSVTGNNRPHHVMMVVKSDSTASTATLYVDGKAQ